MSTKNAGITLIELIIVLVIMGLIFTSAAITFSGADKHRLSATMANLQNDLNYLRKTSLAESIYTRIIFDTDLELYTVQKKVGSTYVTLRTVELKGVKLDSINTALSIVEYTYRGTTGNACTIVLSAGNYEGSMTVNVGSGRVKIKEITKKKRL